MKTCDAKLVTSKPFYRAVALGAGLPHVLFACIRYHPAASAQLHGISLEMHGRVDAKHGRYVYSLRLIAAEGCKSCRRESAVCVTNVCQFVCVDIMCDSSLIHIYNTRFWFIF